MRIALLTEGVRPVSPSDVPAWCDRLVRALGDHDFEVYPQLAAPPGDPAAPAAAPRVRAVRPLALYGPARSAGPRGAAARRAFLDAYRELAAALAARSAHGGEAFADGAVKDRFASGLFALAELAGRHGGLGAAPRSEAAVRVLEAACRAPGAEPLAGGARPAGLLTAADLLERALRPLSAPWYDQDTLGAADLCHATAGGPAGLPGVLAARRWGTPLLVTEYGVRLREHYLGPAARELPPAARVVAASFHRLLAAEVYRRAALLTAGNAHVRRWQERCGAPRGRIRTVHPGLDCAAFTAVGEAAEAAGDAEADDPTLVWVGRVEPAKDLVALLHAFAAIRRAVPDARLRVVGGGPGDPAYLAQCRALAAQLFPDEAADTVTAGENPVAFEAIGSPEVPTLADAYAAGAVVVLSSAVEGFPVTLAEAMFCARATVSTDVGAVREVIGGTGLVVPPRNPRALAAACVDLLRDPRRRARLGAAARARALELFTAEQNTAAFRGAYLDLVAHRPARASAVPFARPAEARLPGGWTAPGARRPSWARVARPPVPAAGEGG